LYLFCTSSRLDTSWAWTSAKHMTQSSIVKIKILFTPWLSNLGCKPWFAKKMFVRLMNALCCYKQTLPWPKILTNYRQDNWLCIIDMVPRLDWPIMFTHMSRGGKLITTSLSYLKAQRVALGI
jgi:hypothetical protein